MSYAGPEVLLGDHHCLSWRAQNGALVALGARAIVFTVPGHRFEPGARLSFKAPSGDRTWVGEGVVSAVRGEDVELVVARMEEIPI